MRIIKITLALTCALFLASCKHRLIVPLVTAHTMAGDYNNRNPGAGYEFKSSNMVYSATYIKANSFDNESIYLAASGETYINQERTIALSAGLMAANGYQEISDLDHGLMAFPIFGIRYKWARLVTTIPAGHIFCPDNRECSDMINFQYVHEF